MTKAYSRAETATSEIVLYTRVLMSKPVRRPEEQVVGAVRVEVERARPIVALEALTGDGIGPNARGGQEHGVTVGASEQTTVHAVKRCPYRGTVIVKFLLLLGRGHAP